MKRIFLIGPLLLLAVFLQAQPTLSVTTDAGYLRSFKKGQRFGVMGHTVQLQLNADTINSLYVWVSYFTEGKFSNMITATGKTPAANPPQIIFENLAAIRLKQYSIGWKRWLVGASSGDDINWSIYGLAGFGLMSGSVKNIYNANIDTALYNTPANPVNGEGKFKRLTFDIGAGWDKTLSHRIFFYAETRLLIPTTDYPSQYLFINSKAPLCATLNAGIRVLFD